MQSEPAIKGSVVMGIKKFIEREHGPAGLRRFLESFQPEDQAKLGENLCQVSWVPADLFRRIFEGLVHTLGKGQGEYFLKAMEFVGEQNINSFMRVFVKLGTPGFVAQNVPKIWRHYFNTGEVNMLRREPHGVEFESVAGEAYGPGLCWGILGWGGYALKISGAKNLRFEHTECRHRQQARCLFQAQWE